MNEQKNPKHTEDYKSVLEKRYATARNIAIALFALVFICFLVIIGGVLIGLFGSFDSAPNALFGILFGSGFLGIISGWAGVFFAVRALFFRSKLHFGTTESITDSILAALVKRVGKHIPAGLISQSSSQEPQHASADELAELRREREENWKNRGGVIEHTITRSRCEQ